MAHPKRRPPCQNCGGANLNRMAGGWANDETVPLNYYGCRDCGKTGLTGEFWLPSPASITSLDVDKRLANRMYTRKHRGITWRIKDSRFNRRITSDTLVAEITVVPGQVQRGLEKRLAKLRQRREVLS